MKLEDFKLERYFSKYEFNVPYLLCPSDCESFAVNEILTKDELIRLSLLRLGYTESQGNPILRKEIAKLFEKSKPEDIVVCAPEEGIFVAMNALLNPGDKVIVQYPCYQSLFEVARGIGCEVVKWEPIEGENEWQWNIDFLKKNINPKTKLIVINSPHNPTGHLFSREEFKQIIEIARKNNSYVFSDEMYHFLEYSNNNRLPFGSDVYEKCISLFGMSKTFGLPGLRIGWLSIREKTLLNKILAFKNYTTICSSAVSEFVAISALKKMDKIISRNLDIIKNNLGLLDEFFSRHSTRFSWVKPKAGPIAFAKILFNKSSFEFCEDVVKKAGVMLLPSTEYNYGNKHFRVGFGRKSMPDSLKVFENYIKLRVL